MFDKNKFAKIIKNIKETYISQEEFSQKSEIGRTYLSQYMNMKLSEPPKPKILKKLADASNGITTYEELMIICGYSSMNIEGIFDYSFKKYVNNFKELGLTDAQINDLYKLFNPLYTSSNNFSEKLSKYMDSIPIEKMTEIYIIINKFVAEHEALLNKYDELLKKELSKRNNTDLKNYTLSTDSLFNIPVLGKIAAGQPILAEEYLEGYLPVDPNIYGMTTPDDYFYLKVSGESMNLKVHNGDYALIHKQDYADNGDIIVAIVNGDDEATLKKYKRINQSTVALEPMSTLPMEPIYVNLKDTNFKIIGKAIGQFGKF